MTKLLLRALFILIPFLYSIYLSAQPKKEAVNPGVTGTSRIYNKTTGKREVYYISLEASRLPKGMHQHRFIVEGKDNNAKFSGK